VVFRFEYKYKYIPYKKDALRTSFPRWGVTVLYLDLSSCSIAIDLRGGLRLRFAMVLAILSTSLVIYRKCLRKSSMGLMWTPSILYDLFGVRYLMSVPSVNVVEFIYSCSMV